LEENPVLGINNLAIMWYLFGIMIFIWTSLVFAWRRVYDEEMINGIMNGVICISGGYFLVKRKSRALALALLTYDHSDN
jgi:hypothetical protein